MRSFPGFLFLKSKGWNLIVKSDLAKESSTIISEKGEKVGDSKSVIRSDCSTLTLQNGKRLFRKFLRHGGILAPIIGGIYLSTKRLTCALLSSTRLIKEQISTPEIVAVGWRFRFPFGFRLLIVSEQIEDAVPLGIVLRNMRQEQRRRTVLDSASLLRSVFAIGIEHRDLHPDNILIGSDGKLYLTDIDDVKFHNKRVPLNRQIKAMVRLMRALLKHKLFPQSLSLYDIVRFLHRCVPEANARPLCETLKKELLFHPSARRNFYENST
jgi:hypothetical protein